MNTISFVLPAWMASALINADETGCTDEESEELEYLQEWLNSQGVTGCCLSVSDEEEFRPYNDWDNQGGSVATYTFPC